MGRTRLARASIKELKQRIKISNKRKAELTKYLHELWNSYQKGLISRDFYVETAHRHFEGKTLKQWIDHYEHYIKECKRLIKKHQKNRIKTHLSVFFFAALIIFFVFLYSTHFQISFTGFAILEEVDFEDWESYADSDATITGSAWTNVAGDDCDWMVDSGGTPSTGTGPSIDHTLGTSLGKYFYMETSSGYCQTPSPGSTSIFNSTESYDADTYIFNVSFWYHMLGSTIGTLYFEVYNGSWNTEWSETGDQTDTWFYTSFNLSDYSGTIQFRFRGVQAGQYYSDFALDDINISRTTSNSAPTTPTNITCDGGNCNISVDTTVNINASGSTDPDADDITYFIEASLQNITEVQNTTDVSKAGSGGGGGGITFLDSSNNAGALCASTSCAVSITIPEGNDRMIVVTSEDEGTVVTVTSVDIEGNTAAGILVDTEDVGSGTTQQHVEMWRIMEENITTGLNTVTVHFSGTSSDGAIALTAFSNVAQQAEENKTTFQEALTDPTIETNIITLTDNALIVSVVGNGQGASTYTSHGTGQTERHDFESTSAWTAVTSEIKATAGTDLQSHTFGVNANRQAMVVGAFAEAASGASNETNTTETTYTDVNSDFKSVTNITVKVEVDSYDPRASVDQSTNDPDLWLEIYNGASWVDIGEFDLPSTYTGTGLDTTNYNFSLTTTDSGILSGWQTSTNQDLRIKGVYMDHNETLPDEINYTNVWVTINGKQWAEIGNHTESTNLTWNTTDLDEQTGIDLRARAIDIDGTNTYSSYFTKNSYLNISHGTPPNQAPTIPFVQAISAQDPVESSTRSITFNFTATDTNGMGDIDNDTAKGYFQRAGEVTRNNTTCIPRNASTSSITFTCTIDMWYFDQNGAWTINVSIQDDSTEYAENSSTTFTYNLLTAMVMSPTEINWPEINLPDTDIGSTDDPITINNSGNNELLNINVTAYNLRGEQITTQYIFANNFTVGDTTEGCSGTAMVNATSINVTSAILYRGNNSLNYNNATSGQEQIFFCLKGVPPGISAQSYSSSAYGAWEIKILLVAIIPAGRRRKKKLKKSNKILKLLIELTDELRKEYSKEKETIINQLIKAVQEEYKVSRRDVLSLIRKEIEIPINTFSKELGALESIVKYMKENLNMKYNEIAKELGRDERTIWTAYKKATEKQKEPFKIKRTEIIIPVSIFKDERLTILESIILYIKEKEMKFSEIAKLLERDQRNIWTIYSRAIKKTN